MSDSHAATRREGFPGQRLVIVPRQLVSEAAKQPVTRDLCITHIGHFSSAGGHFVDRKHGTPEHIMIACLAGAGTCSLNGSQWPMAPGDLVVLPPKTAHSYQADDRSPWTIFWVHFRGLRADDYLERLGLNEAHPVCAVDEVVVLLDAFEDTFRHVAQGFGEAALIGLSTGFARMLGLVMVHQSRRGGRARRTGDRLLRALALMRENPTHPWSLGELAREAGLSVPHFTALCRRQTGMAPISLLTRLRLQRAMSLLQQGTHNVSEAAAACGYEDPFYFSRQFRKHMGVPPSSCRQGP